MQDDGNRRVGMKGISWPIPRTEESDQIKIAKNLTQIAVRNKI